MKQTAVNYLIQELFKVHDENFDFNQVFKKAIEMEREQRIKDIDFGHGIPSNANINYEEYFKLTFKSE